MELYIAKHRKKFEFIILKAVIKFVIEEITFYLNWWRNLPIKGIHFGVKCIDKYDDFLDSFKFASYVD